jgi:hypothetical protein
MVASSLTVPGEPRLRPSPPLGSPGRGRLAILNQLRQQCQAVTAPAKTAPIPTGLAEIDAILPGGGLDPAGLHEWIGIADPLPTLSPLQPQTLPVPPPRRKKTLARESPPGTLPLLLLIHLARQALHQVSRCQGVEVSRGSESKIQNPTSQIQNRNIRHPTSDIPNRVVWIGRGVWPYAPALVRACGEEVLAQSLFAHASHPAARVWAADVVLRSRAAAAVIVDGTGFDLAATRRLQLAAESRGGGGGGGALCLVARPPEERAELSAATTRWLVRSAPSLTGRIRWTVELLRCKGTQPAPLMHTQPYWTLERNDAMRALAVVPNPLDRPGAQETEPRCSTG